MRRLYLFILTIHLFFFFSCRERIEVTEQSLIGYWVKTNTESNPNGLIPAIHIYSEDQGLYVENNLLEEANNEFSMISCGCFIDLIEKQNNENVLKPALCNRTS